METCNLNNELQRPLKIRSLCVTCEISWISLFFTFIFIFLYILSQLGVTRTIVAKHHWLGLKIVDQAKCKDNERKDRTRLQSCGMKPKISDIFFHSKLTLKILPRVDWRLSDLHDKYVRWAERRPWETGTEEVYWSTLP